jgi:hypothetical protein
MKTTGSGPMSSQREPDLASGEPCSGGPDRGPDRGSERGSDQRPQARPAAPSTAHPTKIFPFRQRRGSAPATNNALRDPVRHLDDEEDRRRMQQNVAAAIIVLVLVGAGYWLIDHLRTNARIAACVEAGHRNCVPLDLSATPRR